MAKQIVDVDWNIPRSTNFDQALRRFKRYLEDQGVRETTIRMYSAHIP